MREFLDSLETARPWLVAAGFRDPAAAHRNFVRIAQQGLPLDLLDNLRRDLAQFLPGSADPDMALINFERFLENVRSPLSMLTFLERKPHSLAVLIQLFSTSQYFSEVLIESPDTFDFLWEHGSVALDPVLLRDEILAEVRSVDFDDVQMLDILRRHRSREMARIGFRDIVLGEPLDRITRSISDLADCLTQVALAAAYHHQELISGEPRSADDSYSRLVVLALGKLGGQELNYSSDIDLLLVYDDDGMTTGRGTRRESISNADFFSNVVRELVHLLSANTPRGIVYRVDLRLRPHGHRAALCMSLAQTLAYYERHGRTWERQMLVKARPIAGSMRLGEKFLQRIEPFVYRRYLSFVEINEIKTIKQQIERKATGQGRDAVNIKTGRGGIRDIEFVVQFLQLLHGGVRTELRENNTLRALKQLLLARCLNPDEHAALETAYRFLRKTEHRLQFMFDLQKHTLPESPDELDKLALRLGYISGSGVHPGEEFLADLDSITNRNRAILRHLMTDLFAEEEATTDRAPETDLILDPEPPEEQIEQVLGKYAFSNVKTAHKNLLLLSEEEIPFLSSIRCRHFLAAVAPELLKAISTASDPDMALVNLEKVTASLGAKGVLWESLSHNPPLLRLYVNLCASSQFLSEILINNPGMIDELLETLITNRSATKEELSTELARLLKGAADAAPILHSFKNTTQLGIGVLDLLEKRTVRETTESLSDLAEVTLAAICDHHWNILIQKYGLPTLENDPNRPCRYGLVGLGKLGGRELGYHGDLDVVLLYEADGASRGGNGERGRGGAKVSNFEFFTELLQKIARTAGEMTPSGKLYTIDLRLRPTGRSGALVSPLSGFDRYYQQDAAVWERQALARGRVLHGERSFATEVERVLFHGVTGAGWKKNSIDEFVQMRRRLESSRSEEDIKRGAGGQADVEFAVQVVQMCHGQAMPEIVTANIWDALARIEERELWPADRCRIFAHGYTLLRTIEGRLRIVYNVVRNDIPRDVGDRDKLAHRAGYASGEALMEDLREVRQQVREEFLASLEEMRRK